MSDTITPDWKEKFWEFLNVELISYSEANPIVNYVSEFIIEPLQSSLTDLQFKNAELENINWGLKKAAEYLQSENKQKEKELKEYDNQLQDLYRIKIELEKEVQRLKD